MKGSERRGMPRADLPVVPPVVAHVLQALPSALIGWPLQRVTLSFSARHRRVFERLGRHAEQTFLIDPIDLPVVFRLRPRPTCPLADAVSRPLAGRWDARISGRLAALLGMVHGTLDGDALFFSRDLVIEGDVEAVLALRNALDDAEIDLLQEFLAAFGPPGALLAPLGRAVMREASRLTGVALVRPGT